MRYACLGTPDQSIGEASTNDPIEVDALGGCPQQGRGTTAGKSCLMQDEPGGRGCFACKMSLERGSAMLGIDDQSEQQTGNEPGRDPGFFESQRSRAFRRREK